MQNAQHRAGEPSRIPERREDREGSERERQPEEEVQHVPQRFGALPVAGHHRAQQERQVHPRDAELTRRAEDRREHERADEATDQRTPDAHRAAPPRSIAAAAVSNARCVSPCGKFPRTAPDYGRIPSAKTPTAFASSTSPSISEVASSSRPAWASTSTSQNEQHRNAPSPPRKPSSLRYL